MELFQKNDNEQLTQHTKLFVDDWDSLDFEHDFIHKDSNRENEKLDNCLKGSTLTTLDEDTN